MTNCWLLLAAGFDTLPVGFTTGLYGVRSLYDGAMYAKYDSLITDYELVVPAGRFA